MEMESILNSERIFFEIQERPTEALVLLRKIDSEEKACNEQLEWLQEKAIISLNKSNLIKKVDLYC